MKKKSRMPGKVTSHAEVSGITQKGLWLLVNGTEYFAPFSLFPWFRESKVADLYSVEMPHSGHLYWPALDIDLHVDSLEHPDAYPLLAKRIRSRSGKRKLA
jgi:Protein of unknown function (DUF2442)